MTAPAERLGSADEAGGGHGDGAADRSNPSWRVRDRWLPLEQPLVMGILNLTPDSFSDGGELPTVDDALRRAERHLDEGAAILDLGGESTRPGAEPVSTADELRRVIPVVEAIERRWSVPLSVDTRHADVALAALDAGAHIVNDVSGLAHDPRMAEVVAGAGAGVVLMHMRGTPVDMRSRARYDDVVEEVCAELSEAVEGARGAGVRSDRIVIDPGFGFAKDPGQSFLLLRELRRLGRLGYPILVGPSRKSFLGAAIDRPPSERIGATAVACVLAFERGARLFRVHDVGPTVEALQVAVATGTADPQAGLGVRQEARAGSVDRNDTIPGRKARTTK